MLTNPADREALAAFVLGLRSEPTSQPRLLEAVEAVPRRLFLGTATYAAYGDRTMPIACGETMPGARFAVWLVQQLRIEPTSRVLEVGTGSGYVTALMGKLATRVTSLDRYRTLVKAAEERLKIAGVTNVTLVHEDGREGYGDAAPYDRIILHAAVETLPRTFLEQLAQHGQIVCALGPGKAPQSLVRLQKVGSRLEREDLGIVHYQAMLAGLAKVL